MYEFLGELAKGDPFEPRPHNKIRLYDIDFRYVVKTKSTTQQGYIRCQKLKNHCEKTRLN